MKKKKEFDAVKMMREIRDKLSKIYSKDPEAEVKDSQKIRAKYGIHARRNKKVTFKDIKF